MNDANILELLFDLRQDNDSGASELIEKALEIIKIQLDLIKDPNVDITKDLVNLGKKIIYSRPSMAPLINTIGFLIHDLEVITKNILLKRLEQFYIEKIERIKAIGKNFRAFLNTRKRKAPKIMLISYSSTNINILMKNKDVNFEIFVLESRPLLEGQRVAEILSPFFKTHLIIDAAMGKFIDQVDLVLIGVDSILTDGSIINKIGTFPLALLASERNVDVYAITDSYKYNLKSHFDQKIIIENKPIKEVYDKEMKDSPIEIHNYYFDITPSKYVKGLISDYGILGIQEFVDKIQDYLPIEWFKYMLDN